MLVLKTSRWIQREPSTKEILGLVWFFKRYLYSWFLETLMRALQNGIDHGHMIYSFHDISLWKFDTKYLIADNCWHKQNAEKYWPWTNLYFWRSFKFNQLFCPNVTSFAWNLGYPLQTMASNSKTERPNHAETRGNVLFFKGLHLPL